MFTLLLHYAEIKLRWFWNADIERIEVRRSDIGLAGK